MTDPIFAALFVGLAASVVTVLTWNGIAQLRAGDRAGWDSLIVATGLVVVVLLSRLG